MCGTHRAPRCFRGASRSLGARCSGEFSRDSAPWSSLSFFAKPQPPHSLTLLFFLGISQEGNAGAGPIEFALRRCSGGPSCPTLCMWSTSDSSGFLFKGMLTRNQRGSPPAFLIWLHQPSVRRHHVTKAENRARVSFRSGLSKYTTTLKENYPIK